ncbi:unnamed protein product [Kuraishia capsulata CBS 1993]|uniref:Major facilitator superfamily (MFS) profile domain-containing protein n=1 Tax=Kuraishia capsulata CBS 1993 TaxID=1382522 RepID=W6MVG6_9ASCO|nr:uncharacterized protein KUCA_T00002241001 [Kuraishia capsulata CBS 1993]CDK26270.1 unnamed protein product [Kuraishia capsulata CBS 1993]
MEKHSYIDGIPGTELLVDVKGVSTDEHAGNSEIILIPQPTECSGDPLRWPKRKKYYQLFLVALYACAFSFGENTLGAAWTTVSEETGVSLTNMNGGSALNYLLLGFVNIFWIPAAMKIGRRPVFILTTVFCLCAGVWLGEFTGVAQWMLAQVLNGFGTSAYQAVIQLAVFDMFFVHERGTMIAVYLFGQQLGSVIGLISGGSIADGPGWRWSQYIVAMIDGAVLLLLIFTFEETMLPRFLFNRNASGLSSEADDDGLAESEEKTKIISEVREEGSTVDTMISRFPRRSYIQMLKPWVYYPEDRTTYWQYFRRPFFLFFFPNVVISGFIFAFGCTAGIVSFNTISEILTDAPYDMSTTGAGLVCFGAFVGNIIGYLTGTLSDYVVIYFSRRNNGIKEPEFRLYTLALSFCYAAFGYMMYGWGAQEQGSWALVAVGLGAMIAHQVSACGIATSYAMESFRGIAGELVVVLAMCSSCINFAISYSVQPFINRTGYGWAFFFFGMCVLGSMAMAIPTIIWGKSWRQKCAPRYYKFVAENCN